MHFVYCAPRHWNSSFLHTLIIIIAMLVQCIKINSILDVKPEVEANAASLGLEKGYLPEQLISSLPSLQSLAPSHLSCSSMHCPSAHCHSYDPFIFLKLSYMQPVFEFIMLILIHHVNIINSYFVCTIHLK